MANHLLDTSGLVKYYPVEQGAPPVQAMVDDPAHTVLISSLRVIELHSTLAKTVRTGEITSQPFRLLAKRFNANVKFRKYRIVRLTEEHFAQAARLILKQGLKRAVRTLDASPLAVALDLKSRGMVDFFVTADDKFPGIIRKEGIHTINPERP
jgi:hypothetical protein